MDTRLMNSVKIKLNLHVCEPFLTEEKVRVCADKMRQKSTFSSYCLVNVFAFIFYIWISSVWKPGHVTSTSNPPNSPSPPPRSEQSLCSLCFTITIKLSHLHSTDTRLDMKQQQRWTRCPMCKPFLHWRKAKWLKPWWSHLSSPDSQKQEWYKKQTNQKKKAWWLKWKWQTDVTVQLSGSLRYE